MYAWYSGDTDNYCIDLYIKKLQTGQLYSGINFFSSTHLRYVHQLNPAIGFFCNGFCFYAITHIKMSDSLAIRWPIWSAKFNTYRKASNEDWMFQNIQQILMYFGISCLTHYSNWLIFRLFMSRDEIVQYYSLL